MVMRAWFLAMAVCAVVAVARAQAAPAFGPLPAPNPAVALGGAATMHADSASSDSTPYAGPGTAAVTATFAELGAACPTVLQGSDAIPVALCTSIATRAPVVFLLDPATGLPTSTLTLPQGALFGGVYTYLDRRDRMVLVDAEGTIVRISHAGGTLAIDDRLPVRAALDGKCPDLCGGVVGIAPDWRGRVWLAAADGVVVLADPRTGAVVARRLGTDETVANSISTVRGRTGVVTDHALYDLTARGDGRIRIRWRRAYDRGPARKPGQLSRGSGATPTYFGPAHGDELVAITDNAAPHEHLLVYDRAGRRVCDVPVLTKSDSGTENSPIGSGRSVFVASTYGYPYPAAPEGAEPTKPASAPFTGGLTRVDLRPGGRGCDVRWDTGVRSAAVPRLSVADGLIYTVQRTNRLAPGGTASPLDDYALLAIDAETGRVRSTQPLGAGLPADTLQLAGTIVPGGVIYQGTISGIFRIAPLSAR
ncbi:MAG: hypothetical protein JWM73_1921 [Solirubrobacterales bacterium]|nr:hypothetical protein [Solirubrobacterales bacterium]